MAVTHRVVAERLVYHDPEGVEHISPGQHPGSSAYGIEPWKGVT